jgi:hypothetical protein
MSIESSESLNGVPAENVLTFKIFEKVKVIVDTTIDFPLEVVCSIVIT